SGHRAAVGLDDRLRDVEPKPRTGNLTVEGALRAEEALEQPLALAVGDPDAPVVDLDQDEAVAPVDGEVDRAGLRAELDRVGDEVVEHLPEPAPVAADRGL